MKLTVNIEKKCGDFSLKADFITDGEVFGLLGASGCGKSLTLKCIAGVEKPDRGRICLGETVLFDSDEKINIPARKRNVGYLFQDYALFPNMTVLQNIMCACKSEDKAREFVHRFYLSGKENLKPAALSGGEKQRTAIARMLAAEPELVMFDEPFSAVDSSLKAGLEREIRKVIKSCGGQALLVSHSRDEVHRLTDRIAVMEQGRIDVIQEKKSLFENPLTAAAARLSGWENISPVEAKEDGTFMASQWGISLPTCGCQNKGRAAFAAIRADSFEIAEDDDKEGITCIVGEIIDEIHRTGVEFIPAGGKGLMTASFPKGQPLPAAGQEFRLRIPQDKIKYFDR